MSLNCSLYGVQDLLQIGQIDSIQSLDVLISGLLNGAAGYHYIFTNPLGKQLATDLQLNFTSDTVNP